MIPRGPFDGEATAKEVAKQLKSEREFGAR
jgi:hypothetical protein